MPRLRTKPVPTGSRFIRQIPAAIPSRRIPILRLAAGGYHEGKLYGVDGDYTQMCNIYEIDPADSSSYLGAKCSTSYSFLDLAAAPAMEMEAKKTAPAIPFQSLPLATPCSFQCPDAGLSEQL